MKKVVKKLTIIFVVVLILGGGIFGYAYFNRKKELSYDFIVAKRDTLVQEVSVTGRVKAAESVDLAFEKGGKVVKINVEVGDSASSTQILIELDNADAKAQLDQAQAGVESAQAQLTQYQATLETQQAKLNEIKKGTRPEEIKMAETKVSNAKKALVDAQNNYNSALDKASSESAKAKQAKIDDENNLANVKSEADTDLKNLYDDAKDVLADAYAKADDAINNKTIDLFQTSSNKLSFSTLNSQAKSDVESQKTNINNIIAKFETLVDSPLLDYSALGKALSEADGYLATIKDFLARLNEALAAAADLSATTLSSYQSNIYSARTNVNTAISNINTEEADITSQKQTNKNNIDAAQSELNASQGALALQEATNQANIATAKANLTTAQNNLADAQDDLALKKAGSTSEQIAGQEALVKQAKANISSQAAKTRESQANLKSFEAQLDKTIIRAPIDGVVTKLETKIGEIIAPNINIISLISVNQFEVEAFVPEADVAKVKINDLAKTTVDAYGADVVFETKVIRIEPAETMVEGVATYKTTLQFTQDDERIKSGMTANLDILTNKKENVIAIPGRSIIATNGDKMARVLKDGKVVEVKITTGIRGSDGRVEVLSGINEGDEVITFTEE